MNIDIYENINKILGGCDSENVKIVNIDNKYDLKKLLDDISNSTFQQHLTNNIRDRYINYSDAKLVELPNQSKVITYTRTEIYPGAERPNGIKHILIANCDNEAIIEVTNQTFSKSLSCFLIPNIDTKIAQKLLREILVNDAEVFLNYIEVYSHGKWYSFKNYKDNRNIILSSKINLHYSKDKNINFGENLLDNKNITIIYENEEPIYVLSIGKQWGLENKADIQNCIQILDDELSPIYHQLKQVLGISENQKTKKFIDKKYYR